MNRILLAISISLFFIAPILGQNDADTLKQYQLKQVEVGEIRTTIARLPKASDGFISSAKKNEVVTNSNLPTPISPRNRPANFRKSAWRLRLYDMDGTGSRFNISTRGLDPHRGWEFNIRKNGIITNTDLYGYPASHFTLPMEAVERIEMVRGTGALQYGQQFGGLINYVMKQPDTTRAVGLETVNSIGSFGMLSTYNAIGGKVGKLRYYPIIASGVQTATVTTAARISTGSRSCCATDQTRI